MYKRKFFVIVFILTILISFSSRTFCAEESISRRRSPIVEVYEKTRDTVVNISGIRMVSTSRMGETVDCAMRFFPLFVRYWCWNNSVGP